MSEREHKRRSELLKEEAHPRRRSEILKEEEEEAPKRRSEILREKEIPGRGGKKKLRDCFQTGTSLKKIILLAAGGAAVLFYTAGAVYFGGHFYAGISVYGIDCGGKNKEEVREEIKSRLADYTLNIREREDKSESIIASQIDLRYEENGGVDQLLKAQKSYIWPFMLLTGYSGSSPVAFSYSVSLAKKSINSLECMDTARMTAPCDAYISATDTGYEVTAEVMGTTLDESKTRETILAALTSGSTEVSLEEEGCYIDPVVYQNDPGLQADAAAMSELASARVALDFGSAREEIDTAVLQGWITKTTNGEFVISDTSVMEYVESLAAKYDTYDVPFEFQTSMGTTVTLCGGDYGWTMNQNATAIELLEALNTGYCGTLEAVYTREGQSHDNSGIGYTYVEICISGQEMWCYSGGELVADTPVVTGNPTNGHGTPSGGVWAVDAKERDAVLVGEDYRAPVDYWIPFNGNIGIHDLQTRTSFGGDIYLYNGSHGCVNTPYDAVQIIYETVSVGTPVVVYE